MRDGDGDIDAAPACTPTTTCAGESLTCGTVFDGCGDYEVCGDACAFTALQTIRPNNGAELDQFGFSVSIAGNVLIVGGPAEDNIVPDKGLMYERTGATFGGVGLGNATQGMGAGFAVATSGTRTVLGNRFTNGSNGTIEVAEIRNGTWQVIDVLGGTVGRQIGRNVSVRGDVVASSTSGPGETAVFERDSAGLWLETRIAFGDGLVGGAAVDVGIDLIVSGGPSFNGDEGRVALIEKVGTTWSDSTVRLAASDGVGGDEFGTAVAIDGDRNRIAVGAPNQGGVGAVYIFERGADGSWAEVQKITPTGAVAGAEFGSGVDIDDTTLVVGTNKVGGFMFQFHEGEWVQSLIHPGPTSEISGGGTPVAVSDGVVVIGNDRDTNVTGAAHLYERAR